ncbi:MAG: GFA family protein [Pseudomonadota bacterium]
MNNAFSPLEGGCACGAVRYRILAPPMFVHACHCSSCQRQTGAWHAVNALVESREVALLSGTLHHVKLSTPSGAGQTIARCDCCGTALWSNYHALCRGEHDRVRFVRVGTLDEPQKLPPDVHIFTAERNAAAPLPTEAPSFEAFYSMQDLWPSASLRRLASLFEEEVVTQ